MSPRGVPAKPLAPVEKDEIVELEKQLASGDAIPVAHLLAWLESGDERVAGTALRVLSEHRERLDSSADPESICRAALNYFRRSFARALEARDNRARHKPGRRFCAWFFVLSADEWFPRRAVQDLKDLLAGLCRSHDPQARTFVVEDVLEPLFESRRLATLFADWQDDPDLRSAFTQALEWGQGFWP